MIINNNSYIYKTIINSIGIEPISIDINIDEFFTYNKSYISYILGKEYIGETFHFIYFEPQKFIPRKNEENEKSLQNNSSKVGLVLGIIFGIIGFCVILLLGFYLYRKRKLIKNKWLFDNFLFSQQKFE